MVRKKLDNRIRTLIENGLATGHRSMFVVIGEKGRDQVVLLHHILTKATVAARPSVLWCYKKELGFSSHRKKRMREIQKKQQKGQLDVNVSHFNNSKHFAMFLFRKKIRLSCSFRRLKSVIATTRSQIKFWATLMEC